MPIETSVEMPGYDPRDFVGYGRNPPHPRWPGDARIAVNIALNYEAGGEQSVLDGDEQTETVLTDLPGGRAGSGDSGSAASACSRTTPSAMRRPR